METSTKSLSDDPEPTSTDSLNTSHPSPSKSPPPLGTSPSNGTTSSISTSGSSETSPSRSTNNDGSVSSPVTTLSDDRPSSPKDADIKTPPPPELPPSKGLLSLSQAAETIGTTLPPLEDRADKQDSDADNRIKRQKLDNESPSQEQDAALRSHPDLQLLRSVADPNGVNNPNNLALSDPKLSRQLPHPGMDTKLSHPADFSQSQPQQQQQQQSQTQSQSYLKEKLQPLLQMASLHQYRNNFAAAVEIYFEILRHDPKNHAAWSGLGYCYLMLDDPKKSHHAYQQALHNIEDPKDPNLWFGIGTLYDRFGSVEHAEEAYKSVLKIDPNFPKTSDIYYRLGLLYKQKGLYDAAVQSFSLILRCPPEPLHSTDIYFQIGMVYEAAQQYAMAEEVYERTLKESPRNPKVLQQLGWLYHSAKPIEDQHKAIGFLLMAIECDPSDAQTWYILGSAYMSLQKHRHAYDAFQNAVSRDGTNPTFWYSIGLLYFQTNQYRDALDAFSQAIRLNPGISQVWVDLGMLYEACNQLKDAVDSFARANVLSPSPQLQQHITRLEKMIQNQSGSRGNRNIPLINEPMAIQEPSPPVGSKFPMAMMNPASKPQPHPQPSLLGKSSSNASNSSSHISSFSALSALSLASLQKGNELERKHRKKKKHSSRSGSKKKPSKSKSSSTKSPKPRKHKSSKSKSSSKSSKSRTKSSRSSALYSSTSSTSSSSDSDSSKSDSPNSVSSQHASYRSISRSGTMHQPLGSGYNPHMDYNSRSKVPGSLPQPSNNAQSSSSPATSQRNPSSSVTAAADSLSSFQTAVESKSGEQLRQSQYPSSSPMHSGSGLTPVSQSNASVSPSSSGSAGTAQQFLQFLHTLHPSQGSQSSYSRTGANPGSGQTSHESPYDRSPSPQHQVSSKPSGMYIHSYPSYPPGSNHRGDSQFQYPPSRLQSIQPPYSSPQSNSHHNSQQKPSYLPSFSRPVKGGAPASSMLQSSPIMMPNAFPNRPNSIHGYSHSSNPNEQHEGGDRSLLGSSPPFEGGHGTDGLGSSPLRK